MSTYNAVTWLLDRNVDEGRGNKLAFTDTVNDLSYGELQRQSCRAANLLRRLGVRREERVAMIMLDTVDFPITSLDEPDGVRPEFHIFWGSRVAWFDPGDDLPKHEKFRPNTRGLEGTEPPDDSSLSGGG